MKSPRNPWAIQATRSRRCAGRPGRPGYSANSGSMTFDASNLPDGAGAADTLDLAFSGELSFWRGPAPWYFVTVPDEASVAIRAVSAVVSYGWGVIPVRVRIAGSAWDTSLFPKDGRYLVPIKATVRAAERLAEGDTVTVQLAIRV